MSDTDRPDKTMEEVIREDGRWPVEAFGFLHEGLNRAVHNAYGEGDSERGRQRHVSGQDLCRALRELALERWGLLAPTVLARWSIHGTRDFGRMVYLLIEHNFMRKTDDDRLEDFDDVYRFEDAFRDYRQFELKE